MSGSGIPEGRNLALDALRAFLALGVLYFHSILRYPAGEVIVHEQISRFFLIFRVPTFFFISGLLVYDAFERRAAGGAVGTFVAKKFCQLMVPSAVFIFVPSFALGLGLLSEWKVGYYFVTALFIITVAYCGLALVIRGMKRSRRAIVLVGYALATTALLTATHDAAVTDYMYWREALHGNLFFVLGILFAMYPGAVRHYVVRPLSVVGCLALFVAAYLLLEPYSEHLPSPLYAPLYRVVAPILGIVAVYGLFSLSTRFFVRESRLGKVAYYLGQRTLPLYVIQEMAFFLVFATFDADNVAHPALFAIVTFAVSVALTLLIHDLLCRIPAVNRYLFGRPVPLYRARHLFRR